MSASEIERTLVRLAHEIVEKKTAAKTWGWSASSGAGATGRAAGEADRRDREAAVNTGVLDINLYRDDLTTTGPRPTVVPGEIGFDVNGRDIVLTDDVLYTGRTVRGSGCALRHGRPKSVQLLVLIDRGHRELPIQATYTGARFRPRGARSSK